MSLFWQATATELHQRIGQLVARIEPEGVVWYVYGHGVAGILLPPPPGRGPAVGQVWEGGSADSTRRQVACPSEFVRILFTQQCSRQVGPFFRDVISEEAAQQRVAHLPGGACRHDVFLDKREGEGRAQQMGRMGGGAETRGGKGMPVAVAGQTKAGCCRNERTRNEQAAQPS